jgi:hemolysin III
VGIRKTSSDGAGTDPGTVGGSGVPAAPKPLLRGWIHAVAAPAALAAVVVLAYRAPTAQATVSASAFAASTVTLFTMSAIYHLGRWSQRVRLVLRSIDHADILLFIAGTYTPVAVVALHGTTRLTILCVVWGTAAVGMVFRVAWTGLPRWVYVPLYVGLGWVALFVLPQLLHEAGSAALALLIAGGVLYTMGGLAYGLRRPDPWPRVFGFHEIFHVCTVVAFVCQYVAVSLIIGRAA